MSEPPEEHKSAATVLVEMARSQYRFGVSTDGEPFVVPLFGPPVAQLLRAGRLGLRSELAHAYFLAHGKAAAQQALADALLVIEGMSRESEAEVLAQRVAQTAGGWWIDLGDKSGDAIRVNAAGWAVTASPVRFRRTVLTAPLPMPVRDGNLEELWSLLNVAEGDRPLVLAWLVLAMIAEVPHPVLALFGEQGTGKSTAAKLLASLLDPSPVALRKAPRDSEAWVTAAAGSWIVPLDNISTIPEWLSDALCRAVTGDGDVRRQLYTDGGLALFAFRRVVVLTGIDPGAVRGDLEERLLVIDLDVIDESSRLPEADLDERWGQAYPRVFGALLDVAVQVVGALPAVTSRRWPRMADFARIVKAVDTVLGTDGLARYTDRGRSLAAESLTADQFIVEMRGQLSDEFIGTSAELLGKIGHGEGRLPRGWPTSARGVTALLKRQAPAMRRVGWEVGAQEDSHSKITIWTVSTPEMTRGRSPQEPPAPRRGRFSALPITDAAGPAGHALSDGGEQPRELDPGNRVSADFAGVAGQGNDPTLASPTQLLGCIPASMDVAPDVDIVLPAADSTIRSPQAGPCAGCGDLTERYGAEGVPLCERCARLRRGVEADAHGATGHHGQTDEEAIA